MTASTLALVALALIVGSSIVWFRKLFAVEIPENRTPFVAMWAGGAGLAIAALASGTSGFATAAAVLALVGGAFFLFTVSISRQIVATDAIAVGSALPDPGAGALDEAGDAFALSSLAGKPLLMKFFRGHW